VDNLLLYFTVESAEQVWQILQAYDEQKAPPFEEFTRGLYYRGVK